MKIEKPTPAQLAWEDMGLGVIISVTGSRMKPAAAEGG